MEHARLRNPAHRQAVHTGFEELFELGARNPYSQFPGTLIHMPRNTHLLLACCMQEEKRRWFGIKKAGAIGPRQRKQGGCSA
jgi:hypothetical protein